MLNNNLAFIDGQNLQLGTTKCSICSNAKKIDFKDMTFADCTCNKAWKVDNFKFRTYLQDNYSVKEAYYFLGYVHDDNDDLYNALQQIGSKLDGIASSASTLSSYVDELRGKSKPSISNKR